MDLVFYTLKSVSYVLIEPFLVLLLTLLGVVFYIKNRKLVAMQKMVMGESVNSPLELTLSQIVLGILAGVISSLILSHIGIIFTQNSGVELIFIMSILLMLINPRFISFSYSASILGIISIIFSYFDIKSSSGIELFRVDIISLMTFIAVIHIIESILILVDGDKGAIPVFSNKQGKIIGGYALKRYWTLPIAIFIAYSATSMGNVQSENIVMPTWWPLLNNESILNSVGRMILSLVPIFGVIGYSSITFTMRKKEKLLSSTLFNLGFAVMLLGVSQLCRIGIIGEIITVLYLPLSYEFMVRMQSKIENKRSYLFTSNENGICVLEVLPYSLADEFGIKIGDRIISVNNESIEDVFVIYDIVKNSIEDINFIIVDIYGNNRSITIKCKKNKRFGAILVPKTVKLDNIIEIQDKNIS